MFSLKLISTNKKIGPIPASYSSSKTCPSSCPLKKKGCYAAAGPVAIYWKNLSAGYYGSSWESFCSQVSKLPLETFWRHNVAGDLPHIKGKIKKKALDLLIKANRGKKGFTYTHHDPKIGNNAETIKEANKNGFTINLSANNLQEADSLVALGVAPVVAIVPSQTKEKTFKTKQGNQVTICPATYKDGVTCSSCKVCGVASRKSIVGFPSHGIFAKQVDQIATKGVAQ